MTLSVDFRAVVAALSLVAAPVSAYAQTSDVDPAPLLSDELQETAARLMEAGLSSDLGYDILESLTTEIGPRLAGSENEARARAWAENRLNGLGFANVRIEPFTIDYWERGETRAEIVSPYPQPLTLTALGGSAPTGRRGVEADIVRFPNMDSLRAYEGSLEDKIAFIDDEMTRTQTGSGYGVGGAKRREGWVEASKRGAVAVVIRSAGTSEHRFPHTGGMQSREQNPDVNPIPAFALSIPDANLLKRMVARGQTVRLRLFTASRYRGERQSGNVIAEIPGRERPEEIVVIGGHLDSWDLGTGAIDDGAGVAITTAAAKLIMEHAPRPRRTIRLVLWGSEEVGLLGARAYAEAHADELANHVMAAESDFGADVIWKVDTKVGAGAAPAMQAIVSALKPLKIDPGANTATSGGPDTIPLAQAGVPVASLTQNGWDYFDTHHTPNDVLERVDPDKLAQNVAAYAAFAWLAAEMDVDFRAE